MRIKTAMFVLLVGICQLTYAGVPYTPKVGSAERKAICDDVRKYVIREYVSGTLPQPIVFRIDRIKVLDEFCSFQGIPLFKDGSWASTEYIMDICFDLLLRKNKDGWVVVTDLSFTDVPADDEIKKIWRRIPRDFPFILIPEFWRRHFERVNSSREIR